MTLINLENPKIESFLAAFAREHGVDISGAIEKLALEHMERMEPTEQAAVDPEKDAVITLMNKWLSEMPTDPEELRRADQECAEFLDNLNQNRLDAGENPLF